MWTYSDKHDNWNLLFWHCQNDGEIHINFYKTHILYHRIPHWNVFLYVYLFLKHNHSLRYYVRIYWIIRLFKLYFHWYQCSDYVKTVGILLKLSRVVEKIWRNLLDKSASKIIGYLWTNFLIVFTMTWTFFALFMVMFFLTLERHIFRFNQAMELTVNWLQTARRLCSSDPSSTICT